MLSTTLTGWWESSRQCMPVPPLLTQADNPFAEPGRDLLPQTTTIQRLTCTPILQRAKRTSQSLRPHPQPTLLTRPSGPHSVHAARHKTPADRVGNQCRCLDPTSANRHRATPTSAGCSVYSSSVRWQLSSHCARAHEQHLPCTDPTQLASHWQFPVTPA